VLFCVHLLLQQSVHSERFTRQYLLQNLMHFFAFYWTDYGSIGFFIPENMQKDTLFMFLSYVVTKIRRTRNTFCGTWYQPHSRVYDWTVRIVTEYRPRYGDFYFDFSRWRPPSKKFRHLHELRPVHDLRSPTMHQPAKFQRNRAMRGWVISI